MIAYVGNAKLEIFKEFTITTDISNIVDVCTFTTGLQFLYLNAPVTIFLNEDVVLFSGYIDRLSPAGNMCKAHVQSKTADLVASSPILTTGEFRKQTTQQIISTMCTPFDITVAGVDGDLVDKYNVEIDSSCAAIIANLCVNAGVLATASFTGDLVLLNYADTQPQIVYDLEEGSNCNVIFGVDSRMVASTYSILGHATFTQGNNTQRRGDVSGSFPRVRQATAILTNSTTHQPTQQAEWFARTYETGVEELIVTIPTFVVITKGQHITLTSKTARIEGIRLVERVRYVLRGDTQYTELTLVLPYKYGGIDVPLSGWTT